MIRGEHPFFERVLMLQMPFLGTDESTATGTAAEPLGSTGMVAMPNDALALTIRTANLY